MTPERHARVKEVFLEVLACPVEQREALLARQCEDDPSLRNEVEELLAHHDERTITPDTQAPTAATDDWRRAGQRLNLDDQGSTKPVRVLRNRTQDSRPPDLPPGAMVADRYRIVNRLGQGGMGIVYRADDLTLGQPVALKFLSPTMANNEAWLERFRNEVRMARQVTHPAVCRVFDIGEFDGQVFLSMEYVDGEDLSSLIKRIGRLTREKAIDIARQLCIGLAAAHGAGVLHRDLKPANIMLDGDGHVRITDFGLAVSPESVDPEDIRSGTPAYMAPEQISGLGVSIQSDIYSLGLIIYELVSGRQAFEAASPAELADLHMNAQPIPLSKIVDDVDHEVEKVVESCLRKHAHDRPVSALEVAAALPGTNILAAALAANVTPTPNMVAAARPEHDQSIGAKFLVLIAAVLFAGFAISRDLAKFPWERPAAKSPAVLVARAQDLIENVRPAAVRRNSAYGYCDVAEAMGLATGHSRQSSSAGQLAGGVDSGLVFWYRQSSHPLDPSDIENIAFGSGRVTSTDPSSLTSGQFSAALDLSGRLILFAAPPDPNGNREVRSRDGGARALWQPFFELAGLPLSNLTMPEASEITVSEGDQEYSWLIPDPRGQEGTIRVEALARNGIPVLFAVRTNNDSTVQHDFLRDLHRRKTLRTTSLRLLLLLGAVVAIPWAWRNFRTGRIDKSGAWRLAVFVAVIQLFVWILGARHSFNLNHELLSMCMAAMRSIGTAALVTIAYSALEPYTRRHWPQMLITSCRVLSGRLRDALVGRHALIGVCVGCFWAMIFAAERAFVDAMGWATRYSVISEQFADKLFGARIALASYLNAIPFSIAFGLLFVLVLVALKRLVRRRRWAAALSILLLLPFVLPSAAHLVTMWLAVGIGVAGVAVWLVTRFGLLPLTIAMFVAFVLNTTPVTIDLSAWYAEATLCMLLIVTAIAVFGYTATRRDSINT